MPGKGIIVGINPFYIIKDPINDFNRHGPGIGIITGWQFVIKKHFSLSLEIEYYYYKNINKLGSKNPTDRYMGFIISIKIGIKL